MGEGGMMTPHFFAICFASSFAKVHLWTLVGIGADRHHPPTHTPKNAILTLLQITDVRQVPYS